MKNKLIAYCGIDCMKCDAYIGTTTNDQTLLATTAKLWSELNGVTITPEELRCEGCKGNGIKTYYCQAMCTIKQCAIEKKYQNCGKCEKLEQCPKIASIAKFHKDVMDNLREEVD